MDVPLFPCWVAAGFPSPADDFTESVLDLNDLVIAHPAATFHVKVSGDSMIGAGIHDGDIVVVDRVLAAKHHDIIIARLGNTYTIKRLYHKGKTRYLVPANAHYQPIKITQETDFQVWGVVRAIVHILIPKD